MGRWMPPIPAGALWSPDAVRLGAALAMLLWAYDGVERDGTVRINLDDAAAELARPYRTIKSWWAALRAGPFFVAIDDHGRAGFVARFADDWLEWRILYNNYPVKNLSRADEGQNIALETEAEPVKDISRADEGQNIALDGRVYKVLHDDQDSGGSQRSRKRSATPRPARKRADAPPDTTPPEIRQALADACQVDLQYGTRGDVMQVITVSAELWRMAQEQRAPPEAVMVGIRRTADYCRRRVFPFNNGKNERIKPGAVQSNWRAAYEERNENLSPNVRAGGGVAGRATQPIPAVQYRAGGAVRSSAGRNPAPVPDLLPDRGGAREPIGVQRPPPETSE